ncbi:MAG TPA: DedA family protein [Anaerolineae bacterium]|nr:DedA family protein [Anaerolineae bacterium]
MSESQIFDLLLRYFNVYGYYIVFLLLFLENFFVIGLVMPGETILLIAAFAASQGVLTIVYVIITAAIAAITGNIAGYFIGKKGGRPLIEKYGGRFVSAERIEAAERYFDVHGPKTVFIGRFAAGVRVFIPLLAGASQMNFAKFILYTVAAVISWTVGIGIVGFFFGQNWVLISKFLGRFGLVALATIVVFIIIYYIIRRRNAALPDRD